ncbi:MAG: hypothetical protein IKP78_04945 [Ruminococcus sp.]|nr:hypothetical protein [Ruminococcus sp.]
MKKFAAVLTALSLLASSVGALPVSAAGASVLGDCNGDGKVDATDASAVLKYYSELSTGGSAWTADKTAAADMDKSGKVDATDASYILGFYSLISTGGTMTSETYMERRMGGYADFTYYSNVDVRAGMDKLTLKVGDISQDSYIQQQYPEGVRACAYEVSIYKCTSSDGVSKRELISSETTRDISKGERVYRYYSGDYHEPCDVFSVKLPSGIDPKAKCSYSAEVRAHYNIGGIEVTASNTSSGTIDMIPLIVNSAALTPHDSYNLYNIKVDPPVYKDTYYVSAADKKILDDFAAEHFTADMSNYDKIEYTWDWLNKNVTYASGNLYNDIISDSWVSACFVKKKGQCLQYNGALAEMMVYMGYDVYMLEMWLNSDGTNQHFRAEVVIDGQAYSIEVGNYGSYAGWLWLFEPIDSSLKGIKR